jgi:hypothetical protein
MFDPHTYQKVGFSTPLARLAESLHNRGGVRSRTIFLEFACRVGLLRLSPPAQHTPEGYESLQQIPLTFETGKFFAVNQARLVGNQLDVSHVDIVEGHMNQSPGSVNGSVSLYLMVLRIPKLTK